VFVVAPKEESTGEPGLSVQDAKKMLAKWEMMNRLRPNAQNAMNLACIYYTLGDAPKAIHAAKMVVEALAAANGQVPPQIKATAIFNLGMFYRGLGQFGEAKKLISEAWDLDKSSAYLGMGRAEEYLREGNWQEGWKLHNRVRGTREQAALSVGLAEESKYWDGKEDPRELLVINEGGAGDRINYTRWLPLLTARGINWSFFCFDELKPFYDRLPWIGAERTIGETQKKEFSPMPSHWTTPFALPEALGVDPKSIPDFPTPFTAPENSFSLESDDGLPFIGLCWNANELFQGGLKVRSITEGQAMRLVCLTAHKVHWVNLQHGHKMPYPVLNVPFETWQDTSVLLSALDGLVTVDCGTLWLSLAMKKPTAAVLSSCEDWKFSSNWSSQLKMYHNGPSGELFSAEHAIDLLISDIRKGAWPHGIDTHSH
jgi:hypothetical protein